jgi:hypothetical protein
MVTIARVARLSLRVNAHAAIAVVDRDGVVTHFLNRTITDGEIEVTDGGEGVA